MYRKTEPQTQCNPGNVLARMREALSKDCPREGTCAGQMRSGLVPSMYLAIGQGQPGRGRLGETLLQVLKVQLSGVVGQRDPFKGRLSGALCGHHADFLGQSPLRC